MTLNPCKHCGACCIEPSTQINITVCDIIRLSKKLNMGIKDLFKKHIGINPFKEDEGIYSYEFGLNIPCTFYDTSKEQRKCQIYDVRPINCRLFPYWIMVIFDEKGITDPTTACLKEFSLNKETKKKYEDYRDKLSAIIDQEAIVTVGITRILKIYNLKIDLKDNKEFQELDKLKKETPDEKRFVPTEKVKLAKKMFNKEKYKEIPQQLEIELNNHPELFSLAEENKKKLDEIETIIA